MERWTTDERSCVNLVAGKRTKTEKQKKQQQTKRRERERLLVSRDNPDFHTISFAELVARRSRARSLQYNKGNIGGRGPIE